MRRTTAQVRDELDKRYRAHLRARARFRRQLFVCGSAFAMCIIVVLVLGGIPTDRDTPPVPPTESSGVIRPTESVVSTEQSSFDTEWTGSEDAVTSEEELIPPATNDDKSEESPEELLPPQSDETEEGPEWWPEDAPADSPTESSEDVSNESSEDSGDTSEDDLPPTESNDLMAGIDKLQNINEERDPELVEVRIDFAFDLFRASLDQKGESGVLVSPLSAELALGMIASGAQGDTLAELEQVLLDGEPIDRLNRYHHTYFEDNDFLVDYFDLQEPKISCAMWFDEPCNVSERFLQKLLSYYDASAYKTNFDGEAVQEINDWVNEQTNGRISRLYDSLSPDVTAVLVNTLMLDIAWDTAPTLRDGVFTAANGMKRNVTFLCSDDDLYIENDQVTGILRIYDRYEFIVLMPKEGIDIYEYAASLNKEDYFQTVWPAHDRVTGCVPQFTFRGELDLTGILPELGIVSAFDKDKASFDILTDGKMYLTDFTQENVIELTPEGTSSASATGITASPTSASKTVVFDRPFVYFINDRDSMPIYIGVLTDIPQ